MATPVWERLSTRWQQRKIRHQTRAVLRDEIDPLFAGLPADATILEIGGSYNPRFLKSQHPRLYCLDHATQAELVAKYSAFPSVKDQVDRIQPVDFVFDGRPIDQLIPPGLRFDVIYGSHTLEHQVDLIGHLQSLQKLLAPGGQIIHIVPDLRTCFDALRYPTQTADVLVPHLRAARVHQGKPVFEAFSREVTANLGHTMVEADFHGVGFARSLQNAYETMVAAEAPAAPYLDLHAWAFVPESFRLMMVELRLLGLVALRPRYVSRVYGNQFCAVLEAAAPQLSTADTQALSAERLALARQLRLRG